MGAPRAEREKIYIHTKYVCFVLLLLPLLLLLTASNKERVSTRVVYYESMRTIFNVLFGCVSSVCSFICVFFWPLLWMYDRVRVCMYLCVWMSVSVFACTWEKGRQTKAERKSERETLGFNMTVLTSNINIYFIHVKRQRLALMCESSQGTFLTSILH